MPMANTGRKLDVPQSKRLVAMKTLQFCIDEMNAQLHEFEQRGESDEALGVAIAIRRIRGHLERIQNKGR